MHQMKAITRSAIAWCCVLLGTCAHAQTYQRKPLKEIEKRNIVKLNLISPFVGTLSIQNERVLDEESSIQLGLYYFSGSLFGTQYPEQGFCFTPEYRMYLSDEAPRGFYIQPYLRFARFWQEQASSFASRNNTTGNANFYGVAGGIVMGRQWVIADRVTFDMYIGPLYTKTFFDDPSIRSRDLPPMFNGYWFRGGITFGFMFK